MNYERGAAHESMMQSLHARCHLAADLSLDGREVLCAHAIQKQTR